ncbi:hypothetical protein [Gordonia desulfuricans]|nr:hypothetical protein [Gordonia desulfuricans]
MWKTMYARSGQRVEEPGCAMREVDLAAAAWDLGIAERSAVGVGFEDL